MLAGNLDNVAAESTSDFIAPPRVHENGVFVYHSRELGNTIRKFRSLEAILLPGALLAFTYPVFAAFVAIPSYIFLFNVRLHSIGKREKRDLTQTFIHLL